MKTLLKFVYLTAFIVMLSGCATSFQDASGKTLASVAQSVDSAMKSWAMYVVTANPPADQQAKVRDIYTKYQVSFDAALKAYNAAVITKDKTAWEQASAALLSAQASLLSIVQAFNLQTK